MPLGLTNTPAIFQDYINKFLVEKLDIFIIVYLDDILIYTKNEKKSKPKPYVEFFINWRNFVYMSIWKNIAFIKKKFDFLVTYYLCEVFVWKMRESKQSSSGLNPNQYKISRFSLNLPIFISDLFKVLVILLYYSSQC